MCVYICIYIYTYIYIYIYIYMYTLLPSRHACVCARSCTLQTLGGILDSTVNIYTHTPII